MHESAHPLNLFDAIGGRPAIVSMVTAFYERVLQDEDLAPFFAHVSIDRLRTMQYEFFSAALGGPTQYEGRPVAHAHQALKITRRQFQRFVEHLFDTLKAYPLSEQDRYDVIARLNLYSDDVIGIGAGIGD